MKILDDQFTTACECGKILRFEQSDIHTEAWGQPFITCPSCGREIEVDYIFAKKIKKSNINFPDDYFCFNNEYTATMSNEEVNSWVARCISNLEKNDKDVGFTTTASGDTHVAVYKLEDEYEIIISKNYYRCGIERE